MSYKQSNLKVCKFGGTSLSTPKSFGLVKDIVFADKAKKFIVASAQGKRFVTDKKVTDLLILLSNLYEKGETATNVFEQIKTRHLQVRDELKIDLDIEKEFQIIADNMSLGSEYLISRGEYLNAKLLAKYLGYNFFNAKDFFIFTNGKVNIKKSVEKLKNLPKNSVIPGYYGIEENSGNICLFSRGGSDISGAILALSKNCKYENFTDTCGILSADPKIVENTEKLEFLSYGDAYEMSKLGANVIHKSVSKILKGSDVYLNVLNTFSAKDSGTLVYDGALSQRKRLAVTVKGNTVSIVYGSSVPLLKQLNRHISVIKKENLTLKKTKINFEKGYISFETCKRDVKKLANLLHERTKEKRLNKN